MTLAEAMAVLGPRRGHSYFERCDEYVSVSTCEEKATLDGNFTADELEAIAVYVRSLPKEKRAEQGG